MHLSRILRKILLVAGDIIALYAALFAALLARYGGGFYSQFTNAHAAPFTIVFAFWIVIFYIAGLYDLRRLRNNLDFLKMLGLTLFVNAILAILFFYLIPTFGITPKTTLFLMIAIFACLELYWRRGFNRILSTSEAPNKVLLIGSSAIADIIVKTVHTAPQLGYEIKTRLTEEKAYTAPQEIRNLALEQKINLVVVPRQLKNNPALTAVLYDLLGHGVEIRDLIYFYELIMRKVPLADLEETWFLENLAERERFYDQLKRAGEFLAALAIGIVLLPLEIFIAILVKLTSRGPVIYCQARTGKNDKKFTLYKFRTMKQDAEKDGPQWKAGGARDPRLTPIGGILVASHLDELPQLINILNGELSFVGPRPERPEFVRILKEKIPYYEIRHLVKPGVSGWAQINYRYGASVEDSYEKLEYDIYYVKNRSIFLDLAIVLKTLKSFFVNPE